jgi:hypothetical protein
MRAFTQAKVYAKPATSYGDDYVSQCEYWVAFDRIDRNDDHRISKAEFEKAQHVLEKWDVDMSQGVDK